MGKYSKEKVVSFLESLEAASGNISVACKAQRIARKTFYEWMKKEDQIPFKDVKQRLSDHVQEIQDEHDDNVETAFYKNALDGDTTAQIFYLKTRCKHRGYTEKLEIDANIQNQTDLTIIDIGPQTLDGEDSKKTG